MFYIINLIKRIYKSLKKKLTNQPYTLNEQTRNKCWMEDTTHSELFLSFTGDNSRPKIIYRFIIKTMLSFEGHKYIAYFCQFLTFL